MKHDILRLGITGKLLLYLFLIGIVPLLALGVSSYQIARATLQKEVSSYTQELVKEYAVYLDRLCAEVEGLTANIAGVKGIRSLLQAQSSPADDFTSLATRAKIGYILSDYIRIDGLVSIDIFAQTGAYYHIGDTLDTRSVREDVRDRIIAAAASFDREVVWTGIEENINATSRYPKVLTAVRALKALDADTRKERVLGHLLVSYDAYDLHQQFARVNLGEGAFLLILDRENRIIYHPDRQLIGALLNPTILRRLQGEQGAFTEIVEGRDTSVIHASAERTGWRVLSFIPVEELTAQTLYIRDNTVLVVGLCLIFIAVLAVLLSHSIVAPVRRLTRVFQKIQDDDADWSMRFETSRSDEIGELMRWFDTFLDNLEARRSAEKEMVRAKEAAAAAVQAKGTFLANMSHELRTPLNGIMGMTELALETELTAEQRAYLTMVQASSDRLLALVNDVLDYSKLESGKEVLDLHPFRVRNELCVVLRSLALLAHQKGLELVCDVAPHVPDKLRGDARRLGQIVINLASNAIKFTDAGEVVVGVSIDAVDDAGAILHLAVRDTGIGIPADKLSAIFEVFVQADASTTRKYGGTGLGLAIALRLAEMMDGRLWAESELGRGSTFHATLRMGLVEGGTAAGDADARRAPRITPGPGTPEWHDAPVLIVDDNDSARRVLVSMLEHMRLRPTAAASGEAALRAVDQATRDRTAFALVLLDARMPGLDGFGVAERLVRDAALAGSIVMMLTLDELNADTARCHALGIRRYLTKPIREAELGDAIAAVLGDARATAGNGAGSDPVPLARDRRLRILLVEDNEVNQKVATALLERQEYFVHVASNGAQAVARLAADLDGFDLVLMDIQMPVMDGFEATSAIRAMELEKGGHVPIIAITAHTRRAGRERCLAAGMDGYIEKPIQADELYQTIRELCASRAMPPGRANVPGGPNTGN
jgi:signal transduction histidine kinase/CheY-like chemotaxis protein